MAPVTELQRLAARSSDDPLAAAKQTLCEPRMPSIEEVFATLTRPERRSAYRALLAVADDLQRRFDDDTADATAVRDAETAFDSVLDGWRQRAQEGPPPPDLDAVERSLARVTRISG